MKLQNRSLSDGESTVEVQWDSRAQVFLSVSRNGDDSNEDRVAILTRKQCLRLAMTLLSAANVAELSPAPPAPETKGEET